MHLDTARTLLIFKVMGHSSMLAPCKHARKYKYLSIVILCRPRHRPILLTSREI